MLQVLDIQSSIDYLEDESGKEYEFIIVTAIPDRDEKYYDYWFAKESDKEDAIKNLLDTQFYAYLPDNLFETSKYRTLQTCDIRAVWDYIEKHID